MFLKMQINENTRRMVFEDPKSTAAIVGDSNVDGVIFYLPENSEYFEFRNAVVFVIFFDITNKSHKQVLDQVDDYSGMPKWVFDDNVLKNDVTGQVSFFLHMVISDTSGTVLKSWNTLPSSIVVYKNRDYDNQEEEATRETDIDRLAGLVVTLTEKAQTIGDVEKVLASITGSAPKPVDEKAKMIDDGHIYLYTGDENNFITGALYYYVDGTLTYCGIYGSYDLDKTLTETGKAADAGAVGAAIDEVKEDLNAVSTEAEVLTQVTSSGYETYNTYYLNSGIPVSSDNAYRNIFLIPVSAGDKIRALLSARTSGEARYAFHSTAEFASCTSDTLISTGSYTDEAYNDFTAPTGAACLLIAAKILKQCFDVKTENVIPCLGVSDTHYHITEDVTLSVNTGWQAVSVRTIIPAGKKVTATLTTEATHGTIQVKIGRSGNTTAFNMDYRIGYGPECSFYTTEFVTGVLFNVYNVSVESTATIDIDVTDENEAAESENILYKSLGKNLFNKNDVLVGAFFNTELKYSAGNVISGHIPIANGETLACNYTSGSSTGFYSAVLVKDKYSAEAVKTSYDKTITNDLGYDCYALWMISSGRDLDTVQIELGEYVSEFKKYNEAGAYVEEETENTHGKMGALYPEEMKVIDKFIDGAGQTTYKLHFVHISDNHNSKFGNADDFTDNSNASFLVNTGDMVHDAFSDSFDVTSGLINAMTKPCYITLGNHDVYGASTLQARYDKFFAPIAEHNNMTDVTKTYYAVDFATQGVKCIFLDNFDGIDDLATAPINTNGVMSQEQIEWLFDQLDDALTNGYHVCIFQHYAIDEVSQENSVLDWYDQDGSGADTVNWMPQTIDAFQRGTTVSFTYQDVEYTHTFSGYGTFVAYFVGHEHCDIVGTIDGYPHQLNITVARPEGGAIWEGASRVDYAPYVFNYCTVDTKTKHLSVYRVGQQRTVYGTKRECFTWRYWTAR